jgi:hypothetical protein
MRPSCEETKRQQIKRKGRIEMENRKQHPIPPEWHDALGLTDGTWEIVQTGENTWCYQMTDVGIAKLKARRGELQ